MADELEVPLDLYSRIPDDADENTKLYMRAQVVIQGAFYSLGDREISPGETTLGYGEIEEILCAALGMLVAGDDRMETRRDIRLRVDQHARFIRSFAEALHSAQDRQAVQILDMLRMRKSSTN